ncbi:hypothetical protein GCM10009664_37090 [Kitasatospora gansuensis]
MTDLADYGRPIWSCGGSESNRSTPPTPSATPPLPSEQLRADHPDLAILPNEPYRFTATDGRRPSPACPPLW